MRERERERIIDRRERETITEVREKREMMKDKKKVRETIRCEDVKKEHCRERKKENYWKRETREKREELMRERESEGNTNQSCRESKNGQKCSCRSECCVFIVSRFFAHFNVSPSDIIRQALRNDRLLRLTQGNVPPETRQAIISEY